MKKIYSLIFISLITIICLVASGCELSDYVHITSLEYKAEVIDELKSGGKVKVTERLTFEIHAASESNLFWELWRDLPEMEVDGLLVTYNVLSVKRLTVDGKPDYLEFEKANNLYWYDWEFVTEPNRWYHSKGPYDGEYNFECLLFYVDGLYRETTVFEIEYEMYNANFRYGDCSELYLSIYSGETAEYLKSLSGQILIPENKMPRIGNYDFHTYGTNSHTFPFTESSTINPGYHTFLFDLTQEQLKFKPYNQYIEFALVSHGEDKHKFSEYAPINNYYNINVYDEILSEQKEYEEIPSKYLVIKLIVLLIAFVTSSFVILGVLNSKRKKERDYKFYTAQMDFEYFRDIPGNIDVTFAGALAFCKDKLSDDVPGGYAATMLSLVRKKYISVEQVNPNGRWNDTNVRIVINTINNSLQSLTPTEELYYNLIRRHANANSIVLAAFQKQVTMDYEYTNTFVQNIKRIVPSYGYSKGYFQKQNYKELKIAGLQQGIIFIVAGMLIALIANLISYQTRLDLAFGSYFILGLGVLVAGILTIKYSKKHVLLTQFGENEYSKWHGLYKFLNDDTLMNERGIDDLILWEEYLVYATAFGISEKVLKALSVKFPNYNFDTNTSLIIRHPFLCSMVFTHSMNHSFRTSTHTAVTSYRVGGSGGFGGYGGGGRGGGGGGGGH